MSSSSTTNNTPALRSWLIALLAVLGAAFVGTRIGDINTRPLWADECGQAWMVASNTISEMYTRALEWDRNPPLYSLILFPVARLGNSEPLLRSLSLACGLAALFLSYGMARQWMGRFGATIFALLWGASPSIAFYSREARPYALALLALTAFLYALGRHLKQPSKITTVALVFTTILGSQTIYTASLIIGGCLCAAFIAGGRRFPEAKIATGLWSALAGLAVSSVFLAKFYLSKYEGLDSTAIIHLRLPENPTFLDTATYAVNQTVQLFAYVSLGQICGERWAIMLTVVGCMLMALVVFAAIKGFTCDAHVRVLLIALGGVITGLLALSFMKMHPFGQGRHCLVVAPLLLLCAAAALEYLHRLLPVAAVSLATMIVMLGLASSFRTISPNYCVEELPGALEEARPLMAKHDVLVVPERARMSFEYYKRRFSLENMSVVTPASNRVPESHEQSLSQHAPAGVRYWFIVTHYDMDAEVLAEEATLPQNWTKEKVIPRHRAQVSLWTAPTRATSASAGAEPPAGIFTSGKDTAGNAAPSHP